MPTHLNSVTLYQLYTLVIDKYIMVQFVLFLPSDVTIGILLLTKLEFTHVHIYFRTDS